MFLMLCNAPGVPIGRGMTHDTPNTNSCQNWAFYLPPVFMSQNAKTITFGLRPDNQYFPLTASPSLAFISLHDMAASRGVEPRGTGKKKIGNVLKRSLAKFPEKKSFLLKWAMSLCKAFHRLAQVKTTITVSPFSLSEWIETRTNICKILTSVLLSCKIISVWVRDEVFRTCLFCSIAELTHVTRQYKIKALTSIICLTFHQAPETEIGRHCLVNMSL